MLAPVFTRRCVLCAQGSSFKYFPSIEVIGEASVYETLTQGEISFSLANAESEIIYTSPQLH